MNGQTTRRPAGQSSWKTTEEMKQMALVKIAYYSATLHPQNEMVDLTLCKPFTFYSLKGQNRAVEKGWKNIAWLMDQMVKRLVYNNTHSDWTVAMVITNQAQTGNFKHIARYYVRHAGKIEYVSPTDWPQKVRKLYLELKSQSQ
jgi:hypothetical protein